MKRWYYWTKAAINELIYVLFMGLIYSLISLLSDEDFSVNTFVSHTLCYGIIIWLMFAGARCYKLGTMINISLSMNETRKNTLLGINILNLTSCFPIIIVLLIAYLTSDGAIVSQRNALLTFPCLALLASGLGIFVATIKKDDSSTKGFLKTILYIAGLFSIFFASFFTGFLSNFSSLFYDSFPNVDSFYSIAISVTAIAGILLYTLGNICMKRMLSTYEARL